MKQMKVKMPTEPSCIEMHTFHTTFVDEDTKDCCIVEVELHLTGNLTDWLIEYIQNPVGSRLHKNLERTFRSWFTEE